MGGQFDSGDKEQVAKRDKRIDNSANRQAEDLEYIMSNARGRRWMWELLSKCGVYQISFTGNSETYFKEGSRNIGLQVLNEIQTHCLPEYQRMERENLNETRKRESN